MVVELVLCLCKGIHVLTLVLIKFQFFPKKQFVCSFRDYLTGFRKRKDERRKQAQDQIEKMIKEERKLLRQTVGGNYFDKRQVAKITGIFYKLDQRRQTYTGSCQSHDPMVLRSYLSINLANYTFTYQSLTALHIFHTVTDKYALITYKYCLSDLQAVPKTFG